MPQRMVDLQQNPFCWVDEKNQPGDVTELFYNPSVNLVASFLYTREPFTVRLMKLLFIFPQYSQGEYFTCR